MSHGSHIMTCTLNSSQMFGIRKAHLHLGNSTQPFFYDTHGWYCDSKRIFLQHRVHWKLTECWVLSRETKHCYVEHSLERDTRYWWSSNFCLKSKQIHILHKCWYQCWQKSLVLYTSPPLQSVLHPLWFVGFSNANVICKGTYLTVTVRWCKPLLQPFTRCQTMAYCTFLRRGYIGTENASLVKGITLIR